MEIIVLMFLITLLGIGIGYPMAFSLGVSTLIGLLLSGLPLQALIMRSFSGLNTYNLLAIPFFIIMGTIMNKCGMTQKLVNLVNRIFREARSSLAQINILVSLFMAGVSGSNLADACSIGAVLIPTMKDNGYTPEEAAVITGVSASIGPIFPPSVTMILYGAFTRTSIFGLFLAGVIPGLLLTLNLMIVTYFRSIIKTNSMGNPSYNINKTDSNYSKSFLHNIKETIFILPIPIIIIGGIYGGFFTVTEAGTIGALYSLIIAKFILKIFDFDMFRESFLESALTTSLVGIVVAIAYSFSYLLSVQGFSSIIIEYLGFLTETPLLITALIVLIFFALGCFIPITIVLIIFAPFVSELRMLTGLDVYQFALVLLLSLEMGAMTPPYGTILYVVSHLSKVSVIKCVPVLIPFLIPLLIVIIIVILFPSLTMFLPNLLM